MLNRPFDPLYPLYNTAPIGCTFFCSVRSSQEYKMTDMIYPKRTPRNMKRRFDTHFFASILPSSFVLDAETTTTSAVMTQTIGSSDGKETVSADWITPSEAIKLTLAPYQKSKSPTHSDDASTSDKSMILFPPQFYLLAELIEIKNWRDLVDRADHDIEGSPKVRPSFFFSLSSFSPTNRTIQKKKNLHCI
jgi:nucleoside diphosphate-linked moiety X motif protein 19